MSASARTTSDGEGDAGFYRAQQETLDVTEDGIELSSAPIAGGDAHEARRGHAHGLVRRDTTDEEDGGAGETPISPAVAGSLTAPSLAYCCGSVPCMALVFVCDMCQDLSSMRHVLPPTACMLGDYWEPGTTGSRMRGLSQSRSHMSRLYSDKSFISV